VVPSLVALCLAVLQRVNAVADGAGPDGFFCSTFRVLSEICLDLIVIFIFLLVLFVSVATAE
jgi:hypothetical protein